MTRHITVDVYAPGSPLTFVGTLSSDLARNWLDDLNDVGSFEFEVLADHADAALLTDGRFLRFLVDGTPRWWALIEPKSKTNADPNKRKAGRTILVRGRGALAVTERGIVYPELGLGLLSPETRWFGFMSKYYDDSAWGNATELKAYTDPDSSKPWFRAPKDWKDPAAKWIGPVGGATPPVAAGHVYLRGSYTIPPTEGGEYRHMMTADDGFIEYVDANKEAEEQGVGLWGVTRYKDINQDEGAHLVAVDAINFARPVAATNVFGFILSVFRLLGGGQILGNVLTRSSAGTKMLAFPASPPGLTVGHILKIWHDENQARGALTDLAIDFDELVDSNGVAWPKEIEISVPVGTSGLELIHRLVEQRAVNVRINPASTTLTLQAYVPTPLDLSATVHVTAASNLADEGQDHTPAGPNTVLGRTAQGRFYETADSAAVAAWGRREVFLQVGTAPSDEAAQDQIAGYLSDNAEPADVITQLKVEVVAGGPTPGSSFVPGNIITAPNFDDTPASFLVTGIRTTEDKVSKPIYNLDLETPPT